MIKSQDQINNNPASAGTENFLPYDRRVRPVFLVKSATAIHPHQLEIVLWL